MTLGFTATIPIPTAPLPQVPAPVRAEDPGERTVDPVVESVPARVDRVESDELHPTDDRPSFDEHARESRLACSAASIDEDDGVRRRQRLDFGDDQRRGTLERCRDGIVTS